MDDDTDCDSRRKERKKRAIGQKDRRQERKGMGISVTYIVQVTKKAVTCRVKRAKEGLSIEKGLKKRHKETG